MHSAWRKMLTLHICTYNNVIMYYASFCDMLSIYNDRVMLDNALT